MARCLRDKTEVYINAGESLDGRYTTKVDIRIDAGKVRTELWNLSTDYDAAFAPRPIGFLRRLSSAKTFTVRVHPRLRAPISAVFALDGADEAFRLIAKACHWRLEKR